MKWRPTKAQIAALRALATGAQPEMHVATYRSLVDRGLISGMPPSKYLSSEDLLLRAIFGPPLKPGESWRIELTEAGLEIVKDADG